MQIPKATETVQVIADMQTPFEHRDYLVFHREIKQKFKPSRIVVIGDEADKHVLGDYQSDPDGMGAGDELSKAVDHLKLWYKVFPTASVCVSNHTERIFRRAFKSGIPVGYLKSYNEFLQAPSSWKWADHFMVDGIRYEHGHAASGGGRNAAYNLPLHNRCSTVFGHFHGNAGITYLSSEHGGLHFGMNVGCGIDVDAYAFKYGRNCKSKPILGGGLIIKGVPLFIPMVLDKHKRWIGKLT